jgi:hypothetical protein
MKNITQIIFIAYQPITLKFKKDFYVEKLMQEGFKIEYWDLSKIFNRQTNINEEIPGHSSN